MGIPPRNPGGRKNTKLAVEARRHQSRLMVLNGWTRKEIAEHFGIVESMVSRDLAAELEASKERWAEDLYKRRCDTADRLAHIRNEALEAWNRSCDERQIRQTQQKDGANGNGERSASLRTEDRDGDPRFLAEARAAEADIRKLWGMDAPAKTEVTGDVGGIVFNVMRDVAQPEPDGGEDGSPPD